MLSVILGITAIAGLIISTAFSVDQTVANKMYNDRSSNISKVANEIARQVMKDQSLVQKLQQAWINHDNKLATDILNSSPFGTRIRKLREAKDISERNVRELTDESTELQERLSRNESQASQAMTKAQTSGSAIVDLISGASKTTPSLDSYQSKDYKKYEI